MKKAFLILGAVAVSAAAGGLTAWAVAGSREGSVQYIEREVERTPALGTHFTSYQAEQYPDLTYAAENAVKAVVNIEGRAAGRDAAPPGLRSLSGVLRHPAGL